MAQAWLRLWLCFVESLCQDTADAQELDGAPAEGIYIHGLFMDSGLQRKGVHPACADCPMRTDAQDGAAWSFEDMAIDDQEFGTMFVKAPVINFIPWKVSWAQTCQSNIRRASSG